MKMPKDPTLIIAGGGTGGHILAGVAVADAWCARIRTTSDKSPKVLFVGARGGIEEKLVPRAGYALELLSIGSLKRVSLARRLKTMLQLPISMLRSARILLERRPIAVVGVGGYASGPLVLMARLLGWLWGGQVAILEQNAVPGFTNRILGKFAHRIFSAFPGTEEYFPAGKVLVTGNPVRSAIVPLGPARSEPFTLFIFGGSQGAVGINSLVIEALPHLEDLRSRLRFIHQTGELDHERVSKAHREAGTQARVEKFIYDMPAAYSESSMVISRAGSSTLSELAAVGRAAVLIPLPSAADNHQEKNARVFADAGAALVLPQKQSTGKDLAALIRKMMNDSSQLSSMEWAIKSFYRPAAAKDLVNHLMGAAV